METIHLDENIKVCCVEAASFPEGIAAAHEKLHGLVHGPGKRRYFGISRPENGKIIYKAAAEELHANEAAELKCAPFVIPRGEYISAMVENYPEHPEKISKAFQQLTAYPGIDPQGYCIECYLDAQTVRCMIRLQP